MTFLKLAVVDAVVVAARPKCVANIFHHLVLVLVVVEVGVEVKTMTKVRGMSVGVGVEVKTMAKVRGSNT